MAIDSSGEHKFSFTPDISIFANCENNEEIDMLYHRLLEGGMEIILLETMVSAISSARLTGMAYRGSLILNYDTTWFNKKTKMSLLVRVASVKDHTFI